MSPHKSPKSGVQTQTRIDHLAIPEMNVKGRVKDYPSISDYYKAASDGDKPITYQHGLSNFSSVQLGDERISFKNTLSQDVYKLDAERAQRMTISIAPAERTLKQRKEDYAEANSVVGIGKVHEMEQMMRDKLQQRTKTGPFQLRKTFKYFDRDGSGGIDFSEFQRAMELMGFQFTEVQQLALFARYDENCAGEVNYNEFVEKLMESDCGLPSATHGKKLNNIFSLASGKSNAACALHSAYDSDNDDEEREKIRREEVQRMFDDLDDDRSNFLERKEIELLMGSLGYTAYDIDKGFSNIDKDNSNRIDFDEFYAWYKKGSK